ncbi:MAG: SpaH/EbpB family LPXTG-anchored major pilin [Longicatena sp.]|nr:SpaH/EbpB family LPXTG-anchored major pilin [Longicatena sp.]
MKTLKRLLSVFAVVAMLLTMSLNINAATVVVEGPDHYYYAYQVLSGTQAPNDSSLGSPVWGSGINSATFLTEIQKIDGFADVTDEASFVAKLSTYADDSDVAKAVAKAAYAAKNGTKKQLTAGENTIDAGYYLIVDETTISDKTDANPADAKNAALLQITNKGEFKIGAKQSVPSVDKWVKNGNEWKKYEDTGISSTVTMKVEATIPSMEFYTTYPITFTDDADDGFAGFDVTSVKLVGTTADAAKTPNTEKTITDGYSIDNIVGDPDFKLTVADVKASAVAQGLDPKETVKVVVEYTCTLDTDAVIGEPGNVNKVNLTYNANPDGDEDTKTKDKEVTVYTFQLEGTKVDGVDNNIKLKDAEFKLQNADGLYYKKDVKGNVSWVAEADADVVTSAADGKFGFTGLDAGTYTLVEVTPPAGYNVIAPTTVEIEATYKNNKLDTLTPNGKISAGKASINVENNKGATLPETGGMGTSLFYVIGAALVIGAGVVLVSKKRMAAK